MKTSGKWTSTTEVLLLVVICVCNGLNWSLHMHRDIEERLYEHYQQANMIHRYTKGQMLWVPFGIGVDICG